MQRRFQQWMSNTCIQRDWRKKCLMNGRAADLSLWDFSRIRVAIFSFFRKSVSPWNLAFSHFSNKGENWHLVSLTVRSFCPLTLSAVINIASQRRCFESSRDPGASGVYGESFLVPQIAVFPRNSSSRSSGFGGFSVTICSILFDGGGQAFALR